MFPWFDRKGRLSPLKLAVFVLLFVPGVLAVLDYAAGGARPLSAATHATGVWAIRLLFLSLAVTPAQLSLRWARLIVVRRMIGVAAFGYAGAHLLLYTADQMFDLRKVVSEIALRIYLTIGFAALCALLALALTSTDGAIRRLGAVQWRRLHRLAYVIGALALVHFFLQCKEDITEPLIMAGIFAWLMIYRLMMRVFDRAVPLWSLAVLSIAASAGTAIGEAGYFAFKLAVPLNRVLVANLSPAAGLRPSWIVLAAGIALTSATGLRAWSTRRGSVRSLPDRGSARYSAASWISSGVERAGT